MSALLEIENLKTVLHTGGNPVRAVDGLSLAINKGETFALLGESGCGKSMTALSIMRLLPDTGEILSGTVKLSGNDILQLPETLMRRIRGKLISMIFQEPMLSLNPVMTIADQINEVLKQHLRLNNEDAQHRITELLEQVGIPDAQRRMHEFSFQFSGGMKQRAMIAMALAGQPELLIADEPTTALDVTIQAQVLALLRRVQRQRHMAILLITHDLGVVSEMAQVVAVMYAGEIVEQAPRQSFFAQPAHPYSQQLFASLPAKQKRHQELAVISGTVPSLSRKFTGCRFADRCTYALARCHDTEPQWHAIAGNHKVRCHLYDPAAAPVQDKPISGTALKTAAAPPQSPANEPLLQVAGLKVHFPIRKGLFKRAVGQVKAVDGVSLNIFAGKTLALVGESGCGKTTVGKSILQLIEPTAGNVRYNGNELIGMRREQLRPLRSQLQFVFQDPYSSLNPRMRIIDIIEEGMNALNIDAPAVNSQASQTPLSREKAIDALLDCVGLPSEAKWRYPHEFSGGQRQRIAIARALAVNPRLLICDEPTSALDVSVQAQILNLLNTLQDEFRLAFLFITHNISVVEYLADEIAVMYLGRIVECGRIDEVIENPLHPYTQALLSAVPVIDASSAVSMIKLKGDLPSPASPPAGCHFHPRCPHAMPVCSQSYPAVSTISPTHYTHCYLYSQEHDTD
ncbi:peptide/nickel transport system ATP-binding protein [Nitrosomonas sp. Nm51]|uniref:ABC transporter ATP-binding protein n=1 Tax=Nitrosomonas sp. Nm51 TaxID=133720 RepID=UPI0008BF9B69|nr:ABC transporter ATP-binding protein [Nitrosomonas sp. Nm51]SER13201.1 peptide/nickel transport system ATP-binding protein [Nitrosomonas sp. Nm51]